MVFAMGLSDEQNGDWVSGILLRRETPRPDHEGHCLRRDHLTDYSGITADIAGYDACFFCLGVASAGMSEADYRRVTYDIALAAARALVETSPGMTDLGRTPPPSCDDHRTGRVAAAHAIQVA
jgi:hypothetical protein